MLHAGNGSKPGFGKKYRAAGHDHGAGQAGKEQRLGKILQTHKKQVPFLVLPPIQGAC